MKRTPKYKTIVYGGSRGYDRALAAHKAKGWEIISEEQVPTIRKRTIFKATIKKN